MSAADLPGAVRHGKDIASGPAVAVRDATDPGGAARAFASEFSSPFLDSARHGYRADRLRNRSLLPYVYPAVPGELGRRIDGAAQPYLAKSAHDRCLCS